MASTPKTTAKTLAGAVETNNRLEKCWKCDIKWKLYPKAIQEGCEMIGKAISMPPTAVLSGLIILSGYFTSHATVSVPGTEWEEPILVWLSIGMPTGSGKSPLYKFLLGLLRKARVKVGLDETHPPWLLDEATFEKMGAMMFDNHCKLLGLYDELSSFLTQINLYKGRGLSDSHDLSLFLQLYNGHPWARKTVSGDANFVMERTSLTIGGFTQPPVARSLIELPSNIEKGLSTRFLWIFPEPCYAKFSTLQHIDEKFSDALVNLFSKMWSPTVTPAHKFSIPSPCKEFSERFDFIQDQLQTISGIDELLSGMLSKSKGLILRIAGVLHVLFGIEQPDHISSEISQEAIIAAQDFVDVCCKHAAFVAGRGDINDAITHLQKVQLVGHGSEQVAGTASFVLLLPGKVLDISALNSVHKFRGRGNKEGAVAAIKDLQQAGLGKVIQKQATRGTTKLYKFEKKTVPKDDTEKEDFCVSLSKYGVSLKDYIESLSTPKKRQSDETIVPPPRKSPRINTPQQTCTSPRVTENTPNREGKGAKKNLFT